MATALALLSALALYAGSAHCRVPALRRLRAHGTALGLALAAASLALWIGRLGVGAGLCAMLASWMLGLMLAPCLGMLGGGAPATRSRA
ncbi:hypothetical protein JR065_12570 [Xanthomonas sp. AmX2]|nr:hypothetical protein [Xanthomonas sp.]